MDTDDAVRRCPQPLFPQKQQDARAPLKVRL